MQRFDASFLAVVESLLMQLYSRMNVKKDCYKLEVIIRSFTVLLIRFYKFKMTFYSKATVNYFFQALLFFIKENILHL